MARTPVTSGTHTTTPHVQVQTTVTCSGECPWSKAEAVLGKAPREVNVHDNGIVRATPHDDHVEKVIGKL